MYKFCVYVPETALDIVKAAMFSAGAGRIGNYDQCAWQCLGEGQFRPQDNSKPSIGSLGRVEVVKEYKLEMVCENAVVEDVINAIQSSHPYEEAAFQYWLVNDAMELH